MNRTLLFGIMVFLAVVGISLVDNEQFPVADHRTPSQVEERLRIEGFEPSWCVA